MTRLIAVAVLSVVLLPAAVFAQNRGTPEQQRACRPDVARFCRHVQGGDYAIADCLRANVARLRPACREVIEGRR